jgi:hypothetical protein
MHFTVVIFVGWQAYLVADVFGLQLNLEKMDWQLFSQFVFCMNSALYPFTSIV